MSFNELSKLSTL